MPRKPRKSPAKAQVSSETTENPDSLQCKPQIINQGGFTGLKVPEVKATAIAAALAQGFSVNRIAKELQCSQHTVIAIGRNRPELVDQYREITRKNWQAVAMLATSELIERVPDMANNHLGILAGIATDKSELLSGGPTSRIEVSHKPSADEWREMLASLPEADARVVEVMGNPSQPDAATVAQDERPTLSDGQAGDVQSSDFGAADREGGALVSTLVSIPALFPPPSPAFGAGGEGASPSMGSTDPHKSSDQKFFSQHAPAQGDSDKQPAY